MCRGSLPTIDEHEVQSKAAQQGALDDGDRDLAELEAFLQLKIDARLEQHVASFQMSFDLQLQQHKAEMQEMWQKHREACSSLMCESSKNMQIALSEASEQVRVDLEEVDAALRRELVRDQCTAAKLESEICTLREALGAVSQLVRDVYVFQQPERASRAGCVQDVQDEALALSVSPESSVTPDACTLKAQAAGVVRRAAGRHNSPSPSRPQSARMSPNSRRTQFGTPKSSPLGLRATRSPLPALAGSVSLTALRLAPETGGSMRVASNRDALVA